MPLASIVPTVALPPDTPATLQFTATGEPFEVAVNACWAPSATVAELGETLTPLGVGVGMGVGVGVGVGMGVLEPPPPHATRLNKNAKAQIPFIMFMASTLSAIKDAANLPQRISGLCRVIPPHFSLC